jgi:GTP-binding protein YchF
MELALIGLPNSGKTTVFNAVTRAGVEVTAYANPKAEPNVAIVDVEDERVERLAEMYQPKKVVHATVTFVDFVGVVRRGGEGGEIFSASTMGLVKNADALAYVVRNFAGAGEGEPTPLRDVERLDEELLLADLILVEKRLERIDAAEKKGIATHEVKLQGKALRRIRAQLEAGGAARDLELTADEEMAVRGFQLLTQRPALVIVNSSESQFGNNQELLDQIAARHRVIEFAGAFEMELARLDDDEAAAFLEDIGIAGSARSRLTRLAHEVVGYLSFFTVGPKEVHAWNVRRGDTAVDAAGAVHTDLARGFIRAERFTYDDLMAQGSEKAVKEAGLFHLEGKDYVVQDGDILNIRFSV